ncbi:MAG: helix-turn-helix domain-containing protein [Fimbriimonadales bacterium]|nr:helix-turn-helix domain-containing protein [Fimbriimonadales bacterium]
MNLVDAIRKASQGMLASPPEQRVMSPSVSREPVVVRANEAGEPDALQTVHFEVRLTNQQLYDLLSWLARTIHPVMTLHEAAHYLRLRKAELESLAEQGVIPAFKVDGRWRFLKNALDEWMLLQKATEFETSASPTPDSQPLIPKEESHAA